VKRKSNWKPITLGELFRIKHGFAFKGEFFSESGDYVLLTPGNFREEGGLKLKGDKEKYYTGKISEEYLLKKGDLLVVLTDLKQTAPILGASAFILEQNKFLHNQRLGKIIDLDESRVDINFLFYLFNYHEFRSQIKGSATGSTVRHTSPERIYEVKINLPPLPIQREIAAVLSAYNDLIENNTRRIEILEEMALSLYREWFVNFRFPEHEQVKMVDSELGLIPEGWKLKKLDELGLLGRGKSKHRPRNDPSLYGGDYPFVQTGEVKEASLYLTHYSQSYNEKGLAQSKLWEPQTLLLTIAANIAETAILTIPACFPDSIVGFIADSEQVTPEFIKFRIDDIKEKMQSFSRGTAQDNLSLDKIKLFDFLVPDKDCIQLFDKYTAPLFSQVKNLLLKNRNLRTTRDLLLPKLISGEINLENLENLDIETEGLSQWAA
jgi:type I restriction enzyme S subunit